jgi:hypothetical protein
MHTRNLLVGLGLVVVMALAGCASQSGNVTRVLTPLPALSPDQGRIVIFRKKSVFGVVYSPNIRLNDEVVGRSPSGTYFYVDRPPGTYEVSITTEVTREVSLTLGPGETHYVQIRIGVGLITARPFPELVSSAYAETKLPTLHYLEPTEGKR